jgi:hypothetical protein
MSKLQILDATFVSSDRLHIRVNMDGNHWEFASGKLGFRGSEPFSWNGKSWRVRFQAFIRTHESTTTHGLLRSAPQTVVASDHSHSYPFVHFEEHWKKKGTARSWMGHPCGQCGVSALCNLSGVLSASSDNPHGFASFYVQRGINLYLGQFFITSRAEPAMKPTAWDWSKGPKAGLPTLGKKR